MKIIITGKSATGKDTVADILATKYNYKRVKNYTTRPKRTPEENGYYFIKSVEEAGIPEKDRISAVTINGYDYFSTKEEIKKAKVIIVEPSGIKPVCKAVPEEAFYLLYITADKDIRKALYKRRNPDATDEEFDTREHEEDARFEELERMVFDAAAPVEIQNLAAVTTIENKYDEESMKAIVERCRTMATQHWNLKKMIRALTARNVLTSDDEGNLLIQAHDGTSSIITLAEDIYTAACLSSDEAKFELLNLWLTWNGR